MKDEMEVFKSGPKFAFLFFCLLTGCKARLARNFLIMSSSELKSRLTCAHIIFMSRTQDSTEDVTRTSDIYCSIYTHLNRAASKHDIERMCSNSREIFPVNLESFLVNQVRNSIRILKKYKF